MFFSRINTMIAAAGGTEELAQKLTQMLGGFPPHIIIFIISMIPILELRGGLISLFEGYGASVRTIFLETSLETELARNKSREAVVPEPVIHKMLSRLEIPERYECEAVEWKTT